MGVDLWKQIDSDSYTFCPPWWNKLMQNSWRPSNTTTKEVLIALKRNVGIHWNFPYKARYCSDMSIMLCLVSYLRSAITCSHTINGSIKKLIFYKFSRNRNLTIFGIFFYQTEKILLFFKIIQLKQYQALFDVFENLRENNSS